MRTAVAVLGGLGWGAGVHSIFPAVAIGMASFGSLALPGLIRQSEFSSVSAVTTAHVFTGLRNCRDASR